MEEFDMRDVLEWAYDKGEQAGRCAESLRIRQNEVLEKRIAENSALGNEITHLNERIVKLNNEFETEVAALNKRVAELDPELKTWDQSDSFKGPI